MLLHVGDECPVYSYNGTNFPIPSMICTGYTTTAASNGDSGGPLMLQRNGKYYQIGITSVGNSSVLYVRVCLYCDWITKVTKGEAKCEALPAIDSNPPPQPGPVNQPGPSQDGTTTQAVLNSNVTDAPAPQPDDKTDAPQPAPNPEPQNSSVALTFNVFLLFSFIGLLILG